MASAADRTLPSTIYLLHAVLLAFALPLFLGGLLSDWAYSSSYEIQWINFAAWLIAGATAFTGFAIVCAIVDLVGAKGWRGRPLVSFLLLLAIFVLGLVNSFVHAKDAWATMPDGLVLSVVATLLAAAATWVGFATLPRRG